MTAAAAQTTAVDVRDWLRDPEERADLVELAQAGIALHKKHVGPLAPGAFAVVAWPDINPQPLRVYECDDGLTIADATDRTLLEVFL